MRKDLLLIASLLSLTIQSQVSVDDTLTPTQLIEDVFINNDCVTVTNVSASTGTNFGDLNGIGSFSSNGSDFPFSGIVLTSGWLLNIPGPNDVILSNGSSAWPGDVDLETATSATNTNNASSIQFEFIPFVNEVALEFIMASEEYNQNFECTFSDAFAFILTNLTTGEITNLAVLPDTSTPIEVTNIRPEVPGQCDAVNEVYFDKYNFQPFNDPNTAAINYNGQISVLGGSASVTVGDPYRIKMVVADETDTAFDMAVFLKEESFVYNLDLGPDYTIANGNPICGGDSRALGVEPASGVNYQWFEFNSSSNQFDIIPGETSSTFIADQAGEFLLEVSTASCLVSDSIIVEIADVQPAGTPDDIFIDEGDDDGIAIFNLTVNEPLILNGNNPADFEIRYFETLIDSQNNTAAIADPTAYTNILNPQTIFVRFQELSTACFDLANFVIETDGELSVDDNNLNPFIIYPVPAEEVLNITSNAVDLSKASFELYAVNGQRINTEVDTSSEDTLRLDLSMIDSGLYFLRIETADKVFTQRIIKN